MLSERIDKARTLVEALPYIQRFAGSTIVIKYGGSVMVEENLKNQVALDILLLRYVGIKPVVVHGGGNEISRWMKKVNKEAVFVDGLRVTDADTMEITEMVLSGKINSEIVTKLNKGSGKAVGLSGKDANLFIAKKVRSKDDQDLGQVGNIVACNPSLLITLCDQGYIPVIGCVGVSEDGESLNLNGDHAAQAVASALGARKLIYLTDVQGIMKEGALINSLTVPEAKKLMLHPDIKGGMIPKLECAVDAVENNVGQVHIINGTIDHAVLLEIFTDVGIGTMIQS